MSLVESGLTMPLPTNMQVVVSREVYPSGQIPPVGPINVDEGYEEGVFPLAIVVSLALVWWAFRGQTTKAPGRSAIDANNEGMARLHAGDPAAAIVKFDEALRQDPRLASAHYNRAVVLTTLGRNPEALASLERLFACRPDEVEPLLGIADLWRLRGTLRLDQGDYQGAIDDLSRAFDFEPADPATLLCNRGLAWIRLGQLDQALQDTEAALAMQPDDAVAYNNRGVIFRDLGNLEQAEADLRRALELDAELANPREHLAKLLESKSECAALQSLV
jgi:tetratricopeptide (TPR) repeat protein